MVLINMDFRKESKYRVLVERKHFSFLLLTLLMKTYLDFVTNATALAINNFFTKKLLTNPNI